MTKTKDRQKYFAILTCLIISFIATKLGGIQNIIGAPMIALIIGMLIVNIVPSINADFKAGTTFVGKKFLTWGIIFAGGTLSFYEILGIGARALPLIIFNMGLAFTTALFVGAKLRASKNTCVLVGGGTCICGGTAIATLSSIIKATEEEIAYAMTAIFLFDAFSALTYPYLAKALSLTNNQFAFLAGTAINDTSSVAAAEATFNALSSQDLGLAITIKLARTTMLIFLAIIFTMLMVKQESKSVEGDQKSIGSTVLKVFPWFVVYFLVMAVLNTFGVFDGISKAFGMNGTNFMGWTVSKFLKNGYKFLIATALAGVGFKIKFKDLFTKGVTPIILGGCTWMAVAVSSLTFIHLFSGYVG